MTAEEAIRKLAVILEDHHSSDEFGCECAHTCDVCGRTDVLEEDWATHVANIAYQHLTGF